MRQLLLRGNGHETLEAKSPTSIIGVLLLHNWRKSMICGYTIHWWKDCRCEYGWHTKACLNRQFQEKAHDWFFRRASMV